MRRLASTDHPPRPPRSPHRHPSSGLPWIISIFDGNRGTNICGGTLISDKWVLTAAHCVNKNTDRYKIDVHRHDIADAIDTGASDEHRCAERHDVASIKCHELYDLNGDTDADICLMEITKPIKCAGEFEYPALDEVPGDGRAGQVATIAGWGDQTGWGDYPDKLKSAVVPIWTEAKCLDAMAGYSITPGMICAGYEEGEVDTCGGDSGGPMVVEKAGGGWTLVGITSWGAGCADPNSPGVYARVSYYKDWVVTHAAMNPPPPPFPPGKAPTPPPPSPPPSLSPSPPPPSVCPSSHPFLEKFGKTDSYFCYERAGNNGKVCGMSNSGIAAPADGTWGADQNDCAGSSLCPSSNPILRKWCNKQTGGCWYFCYDIYGAVCGMHNSGIAAPADANWGTDQPNCKGVLCPSSHPFLEKYKPENSYFCYVSAGLSESATGAKSHEVCGMHNSGITAPADGTWGTNQLDCPGRSLCPSRTWEPSSARFLETYKYKDSKGNVVDSGKYFCYEKKGNGGAVCGMSKSGIAPPTGGWGSNQADCSRAECGWEGISKDDCLAQNCRWDEVGPRKGAGTFKCFYVGNTFGKGCRSDICDDTNKDCCALGSSEPRQCTESGYKVVAGGTSKYADCTQSAVFQCCKPN